MKVAFLSTLLLFGESSAKYPFYRGDKPYTQESVDAANVLKYTGWQGPYSKRRGYGINRDPPADTKVDQIVQLTRHGERWPDAYDWDEQFITLKKIQKKKGELKGSLEFANYWVPFTDDCNKGWLSEESLVGPYSGLLHAYTFGVETRRRYYDLYDGESTLPLFASGYERIVDTARKFGEGFLQWNYTTLGALNIIQETASQGANSLVPQCNATSKSKTTCSYPKNSTQAGAPWLYPEYETAARRLNKENKGLNLTSGDIPHLLSTAAFELNVRGSSPWVDVFTAEEWTAYEYAQSSYYYCFYGIESTSGPSKGSLFLNATRTLLLQGPEDSLPLAFSFAHDTDIINLVGTMGIDVVDKWNAEEVQFGQRWDVTDFTPQGAHIVFERLVYNSNTSLKVEKASTLSNRYPAGAFNVTSNITVSNKTTKLNATNNTNSTVPTKVPDNVFVRVVINEAVVPLKGCSSGPGYSCPLSEFDSWVDKRLALFPSYDELCNPPKGAPTYLDFFWNYNTTTELDISTELSYQKGLVSWDDKPIE